MQNGHVNPDMEGKTIGAILREARESSGLTLDEAVRVTRIGKAYLCALEEGRYDKLPSDAYVKGFLRVYAAFLKLPEDEIVLAYEDIISDECPPHCENVSPSGQSETREKRHGKYVKRFVPLLLILILVVLSAFLIISTTGRDTDLPAGKKPDGINSVQVSDNGSLPAVAPPQVKSAGDAVPDRKPADAIDNKADENTGLIGSLPQVSNGLVLKIKAMEDGWLDVTIDDAVTQHYELKSGDLIEWKGEKQFTLDIGNAGGIEAELNGKILKAFGKTGESAHVVLNARAVRN